MDLTRRETTAMGGIVFLTAIMPLPSFAMVEELVGEFTGGADIAVSGVNLVAPEIAENGNTVPIEVSAEGAVAIIVLATGNPLPTVATFKFGKLAGESRAKTRIRLAGSQDVVAVAQMADGSFARTQKTVKVTIGGCGG